MSKLRSGNNTHKLRSCGFCGLKIMPPIKALRRIDTYQCTNGFWHVKHKDRKKMGIR